MAALTCDTHISLNMSSEKKINKYELCTVGLQLVVEFLKYLLLFIYLVVPGLSYGTQDILVVACGI